MALGHSHPTRLWSVYFGPVHLGWLDERDFRFMDVKDKRRRR
jgi:hypothetical protein